MTIIEANKQLNKLRRKYDNLDDAVNKLNYQKLIIQLKMMDLRKKRDLDNILEEI